MPKTMVNIDKTDNERYNTGNCKNKLDILLGGIIMKLSVFVIKDNLIKNIRK